MRIIYLFLAIILLSAISAQYAYAVTWAGVDSFDSYSTGDLTGGSGGSGWSAAWTGNVAYDVEATVAYDGANGVQNASGTDDQNISRAVSATSDGLVKIALQRTSKTSGALQIILRRTTSSTSRWGIHLTTTDLNFCNGAFDSCVTLQSNYSVNQWYEVHISYNTGTNLAKARLVGDSAWSTDITGSNSPGDITSIFFLTAGSFSGTYYFDSIGVGSEPAAAAADNVQSDWWFFFNRIKPETNIYV